MPVNIKGKSYKTVAERIDDTKDLVKKIDTEIIHIDNESAVVKATIVFNDDKTSTGFAREFRDDSQSFVNKTSFLENAETSAVGRALAFAGYGGGEIASADEVQMAIKRGEENSNPFKKISNDIASKIDSPGNDVPLTESNICNCGAPIKGPYKFCYTCNMERRNK